MTSSDSARPELARAASADDDAIGDLDWIAFLYVADELSNAERRAFETRLADDQIAREAVASAVELTQIVLAVQGDSNGGDAVSCPAFPAEAAACPADRTLDLADRRVRGRWAPVAWMSAGAAVCLAAVLFVQAMLPVDRNPGETAGRSKPVVGKDKSPTENNPTENLAVLWSQLRQESSDADLPERFGSEAFGPELQETSPEDFGEHETSSVASIRTPSWMVAAVSGAEAAPAARAGEPNDESADDVEEL